jgi:hypothetical protein
MEVFIVSLTVPDLEEVTRQGSSHPVLGRLLHGGSYCRIAGAGAAEVLAAAKEVQGVSIRDSPDADLADLADLGERGALCVIAADGTAASPLVVLYGRGLPALGAIAPCTVQDLQATWAALAGGTPREGRHLLQEQPEAWDAQLERQLTQRLRQLYGE